MITQTAEVHYGRAKIIFNKSLPVVHGYITK